MAKPSRIDSLGKRGRHVLNQSAEEIQTTPITNRLKKTRDPAMAPTTLGHTADGIAVPLVTIAGGGVEVGILGFGAAIRSLDVDLGRGARPRVLGLQTIADYELHSQNMGIIAGRYANRIGGAQFPLDGKTIKLLPNEGTSTQLHGGPAGFGKRVWTIVDHGADHVTLSLISEAGDQGFPGRVEAFCRYSLPSDGVLKIDLSATTDAPTVVNLAGHSYFNLDESETILDHLLQIPAETYTPVDSHKIPTGEMRPVVGTPFDFLTPRPIRQELSGTRFVYDHNFVLAHDKSEVPRLAARVIGPETNTELRVLTTEPGVQFYDGTYLGVPVPPLGRRQTGSNAGFCLEPQYFPDTPNKPTFGDATLRPGETYRQITEYHFRAL
jgi:aldose 1-epimerase